MTEKKYNYMHFFTLEMRSKIFREGGDIAKYY